LDAFDSAELLGEVGVVGLVEGVGQLVGCQLFGEEDGLF